MSVDVTGAWEAANTLSLISLVVAVTALGVSASAVLSAVRAHRDKATSDAVKLLYAQFQTFSDLRVENWQLAHIFEPPEYYDATCDALAAAANGVNAAKRAELGLKERAIALRIFDLFEQVIFERNVAGRNRDKDRVAFLNDVLTYFTGKWLRNPRLLYLWRSELHASFEPVTLEYHDTHVVSDDPSAPLAGDAEGPYG